MPMTKPPIAEMLEKVDCRYTLVVETAKRARALVDQNEVSRLAETEATQKLAAARSKASEIMRQATQYADTMLSNLEDFLKTELGDVQKSRDNLTEKR